MRVLPLIALVLLSQPALANPWELITGITYKETETETSLSVEKTIPEELRAQAEEFTITGYYVPVEAQAQVGRAGKSGEDIGQGRDVVDQHVTLGTGRRSCPVAERGDGRAHGPGVQDDPPARQVVGREAVHPVPDPRQRCPVPQCRGHARLSDDVELFGPADDFEPAYPRVRNGRILCHAASDRRHWGNGSARSGSTSGPGARSSGTSTDSSVHFSAGQSIPAPMKTISCRRSPHGSCQWFAR